METSISIDNFGRILIPKSLRKALTLTGGEELVARIDEESQSLIIQKRSKVIPDNTLQEERPTYGGVPLQESLSTVEDHLPHYNTKIMSNKIETLDAVSLDKFGRILIPKKVRKALQLKAGQALQIAVDLSQNCLFLLWEQPRQLSITDIADIRISASGLPFVNNAIEGEEVGEDFDAGAFLKETRMDYLDRKLGL